MNLTPGTTEILGTAAVIALLGGLSLAIRRIRQVRRRTATPILRLRRREDARTWQGHFAGHSVGGDNFHRPTQNEILETLHALDHLTPDWDAGAPEVVERRFLNELAQGYPSLCKAGCQFPAIIPVDLPLSLRDADLSSPTVAAFLNDHRNKVAVARERFRRVRAHANALEQFAVGADLPDESNSNAAPVPDDERGWLQRHRWAAAGLILISLGVVGVLLASAWPGGREVFTAKHRDGEPPSEAVPSQATVSKPPIETSRPVADADPNAREPIPLANPEQSAAAHDGTMQTVLVTSPAPAAAASEPTLPTPAGTKDQNATISIPANLADQIAASKMRAVAKYPDLTVANSEMNLRFVYRYKRLVEDSSPRLRDPLWPEQLAEECAAAAKPKISQTVHTHH